MKRASMECIIYIHDGRYPLLDGLVTDDAVHVDAVSSSPVS